MLTRVELRDKEREGVGSDGFLSAGCGCEVRRKRLKGCAGMEGNVDTSEGGDAIEEVRVEGEAEVGQGVKSTGIVGVGGGKHAGGGGRGFDEWPAPFEHGDARSAAMQFEGEREADDACPGDADIWAVHETSLDGMEENIVCLLVAVLRVRLSPGWREAASSRKAF